MAVDMAQKETSSSSPSIENSVTKEEPTAQQLEVIHTNERIPGHSNYYEKDGLRTYGDGQDHDHEQPMTFRKFMAFTAMCFLWTASQIPLYLFGGIAPIIYADIGGYEIYIWFVLGNLLSLAAVCPFVGSLSDLFGRRYIALSGAVLIVIGMIICSTAHTMNIFIGMSFFLRNSQNELLTSFSSRYGLRWCRSRYQRTYSPRCHLRDGPLPQAWSLRCHLDRDHHTIRPIRALLPADCRRRLMEMGRSFLRSLGCHWFRSHRCLLLPTTPCQLCWHDQDANLQGD
jgi:hypothetical protein